MNATPPPESLSASLARRLEEVCDPFEAAWREGRRLRIEDHLGAVTEPERPALLRELLAVEVAYRLRGGEKPSWEEYRDRFPEQGAVVHAAFREAGLAGQVGEGVGGQGGGPGRPPADQNLLFGVLALQLGFITRDDLVEAAHAWALERARPLGQVLLERGRLTAERLRLLEALVLEHLRAHGDDPGQSLAAIAAPADVPVALRAITDVALGASLKGHTPPADEDATTPYAAGPDPGRAGIPRYRPRRLHARGGLGEVYVADDLELPRQVALKQIRPDCADDPHQRSRFLLEAEVTARLEHPGVVPVHGLGRLPDGRPFYAMRLVQGETLKEAIRGLHESGPPVRYTGEASLPVRRLLGRFVAVCQAVAYAHSRGVLHRDLKPANVLLGEYGETLVIDWGLAKLAGQFEAPGGAEVAPRPQGEDRPGTQAGEVLGTPAYMSPEQAAGRAELLGPAADVYGLGAVLYAVLTGRAPFTGRDRGEVLGAVREGRWEPPSWVRPGVPAALEAVCLKAMALCPEDRYPSALALAAEVERWLAGAEDVGAPRPWRLRLGPWPAPRRRALGVIVLAAMLALGLVALVLLLGKKPQPERAENNGKQQQEAKAGGKEENGKGTETGSLAFGEVRRFETAGKPFARQALFSLDGRQVVDHSTRFVRAWNVDTGREVRGLDPRHGTRLGCVAVSPDGRRLATAGEDHLVKLWDLETFAELKTLRGHEALIHAVAFSPDGRYLASGAGAPRVRGGEPVREGGQTVYDDCTVRLWDAATGNELHSFGGFSHPVNLVSFSRDGKRLVAGGFADELRVWDVDSKRALPGVPKGEFQVMSMVPGPGKAEMLLGCANGPIRVWDLRECRVVRLLKGHSSETTRLSASADGRRLLSWAGAVGVRDGERECHDYTMRLWDTKAGKELARVSTAPRGLTAVALSPDARYGLSADDKGGLRLWDLSKLAR